MFDPEKLLGGLVRRGLSSRGRRTVGGTGALTGLGLLGVAMGMVESFMGQQKGDNQGAGAYSAPPPPPPSGAAPPPPPPPTTQDQEQDQAAVPPLPPDLEHRQALAVLLIRAMIAAANSDNVIDEQERERIIRRMAELDLSQEERDFLDLEMAHPMDAEAVAAKAAAAKADPEQTARQVYVASLLAIDIDTAEEVVYLNDLAGRLGIGPDEVERIQDELGLPRS